MQDSAKSNRTLFELDLLRALVMVADCGSFTTAATRLHSTQSTVSQKVRRLEELAGNVHGYMITRDLYYMRARARHKGDRSVGLLTAALGSALDIKPVLHGYRGETAPVAKIKGFDNAVQRLFGFVGQRVVHGLLTPVVCVSYGGPLDELRALPGYAPLRETCQAHGVALLESVMSLTGMVNVGKGAVTVGFADVPHEFES